MPVRYISTSSFNDWIRGRCWPDECHIWFAGMLQWEWDLSWCGRTERLLLGLQACELFQYLPGIGV